jgi:hypothetical protein
MIVLLHSIKRAWHYLVLRFFQANLEIHINYSLEMRTRENVLKINLKFKNKYKWVITKIKIVFLKNIKTL